MKVVDGLYFYPWESYSENNCNSLLITGEANVLIDPGHKHLFDGLRQQVENDGLSLDDVDMVLYTHCHPDHMEAGELLAQGQAKHALHAEDEQYYQEIGPAFYQAMGLKMPHIDIDVHLTEGSLAIGGQEWQVFHTPGHSPGSVCLFWPENKVLIPGDLIFAQGVGRTDFPGGSGSKLKESITRMARLDIELILPGHGPAVAGRDNVLRNFQVIEQMYFPML